MPSKLLVARMRALGIEVAGHMSSITPEQIAIVREKRAKDQQRGPRLEKKPSSSERRKADPAARATARAKKDDGKPKARVRVRHKPKPEPEATPTEVVEQKTAAEPTVEKTPAKDGKVAASKPAKKETPAAPVSKVRLKTMQKAEAASKPKPAAESKPKPDESAKSVRPTKLTPITTTSRDIKRPVFNNKSTDDNKVAKKPGKSKVLYRPDTPLTPEQMGLSEDQMKAARGEEPTHKKKRSSRRRKRRRRKSSSAMIHELKTRTKSRQKEKGAKKVNISRPLAPVELAELFRVNVDVIMEKLEEWGEEYGIVEEMGIDIAAMVAEELGFEPVLPESDPEGANLTERPPIVTVLGHVDHGKTTLLDYIRKAKVAEGEAGGITQHVGAYQVETKNGAITFLDTPGHEAFTAMRARGAEVTDIVVLVCAADDGVMPQTVEAINHARAAEVEIVVAVTKVDRPEADRDKVRRQLAKYSLNPEEWGGDTVFCDVSGITGEGVENLLEILAIHTEMLELRSDANANPQGVIIESRIDKGRGVVATVVMTDGTLKRGTAFVCGNQSGKIRQMSDHLGNLLQEVPPGAPAEIQGFDGVPEAGDTLVGVTNEKAARNIARLRDDADRKDKLQRAQRNKLLDFLQPGGADEKQKLPLIVKGDVNGTVEAVIDSFTRFENDEVELELVHSGVGVVTEADVQLASASNAVIVGFSVRPDTKANKLAQQLGVEIKLFKIIYELLDEVKALLSGLLAPDIKEEELGRAEVRDTFRVPKLGMIAGCYMLEGLARRNALARLVRDGKVVYEGKLISLRRFKDDVKEVAEGYECGIGLERFDDIHLGDVIEIYKEVEVSRSL
ncbi:translation initiation factor IF-2 [bacterium]|nr:translation initiation factor IF-2 [bacterium]